MVRNFGVAPFKRGNASCTSTCVAAAGRIRAWTGAGRIVSVASRLACPLRFTNVIESSNADAPAFHGQQCLGPGRDGGHSRGRGEESPERKGGARHRLERK